MKYWDKAWSIVESCTPVSESCQHCWQLALNKRFGNNGAPRFRADRLEIPLKRKKPTVWFVLSDLFHPAVSHDQILSALKVMVDTPQHTYLILTKRHVRMWNFMNRTCVHDDITGESTPIPNAWFMVTVENQRWAEERIGYLMNTPAYNRGLSLEPLLGPVDLRRWIHSSFRSPMEGWHCPVTEAINRRGQFAVIVGGESGPGHRPVKEEWIKTIRDQCEISNIPFLFKQWHKQNDRMFDNRTYDDMPWRTTKEAFAAV